MSSAIHKLLTITTLFIAMAVLATIPAAGTLYQDPTTGIWLQEGFRIAWRAPLQYPSGVAAIPADLEQQWGGSGVLVTQYGPAACPNNFSDTLVRVDTAGVVHFIHDFSGKRDVDTAALEFGPGPPDWDGLLYISANNMDGYCDGWDQGGSIIKADVGSWNWVSHPTPPPPGAFLEPQGIDFPDPSSGFPALLYVANGYDDPAHLLWSITAGGAHGSYSIGVGHGLHYPSDVAFGHGVPWTTDLYIADYFEGKIKIADSSGQVSIFCDMPSVVRGIEFSKGGCFNNPSNPGEAFLYATVGNTAIYRVDSSGAPVDGGEAFAAGFGDIEVDPFDFSEDGTAMYVADYFGNAVYKIEGWATPPEAIADIDGSPKECVDGKGNFQLQGQCLADDDSCLDPPPTISSTVWTDQSANPPAFLSNSCGDDDVDLNLGSHLLRLTVTDSLGQSSSDDVTAVVVDTLAPVPTNCPNETLPADLQCEAGGTWTAEAQDQCEGLIRDTHSGNFAGLGEHHILYNFTDSSGNSSSCVKTLQVVDQTPPSLTVPPSATLEADARCCGADFGKPATATDNCDPSPAVSSDPGIPAHFTGVGDYRITYTARDSSENTASSVTTVTLVDKVPPVLEAGPDVEVLQGCDEDSDGTRPVALPAPSVSDNCDPNPVLGNDAPALFPIGKTVVTVTATDFSGNTNEDQLTVTVVGYDEYLGRILQELQKMDLDHGTVNAFENKVVSIQEALDRGKCREAKERLESLLRHIIEEWGKLKNLNREQSELLYDMVFKLWRTVEPCC